MENVRQLPRGIYAFDMSFREKEGAVTFTFQGETYEAVIGENASGVLAELVKVAAECPDAPFGGRTFDTPVILVPAGAHKVDVTRLDLSRPLAFIGEGMGISPNADDIRRPNPARGGNESVLCGSFYGGNLAVKKDAGAGLLRADGLTLRDARLSDFRTAGEQIGIEAVNCIFECAHDGHLIHASATKDDRTVTVRDCRADGLDWMEGKGQFLHVSGGTVTVERLYYAHTKKFFGPTDYGETFMNAPAGGTLEFMMRDCVLEASEVTRGAHFAVAPDAHDVHLTMERCEFCDFAFEGDPVIRAVLPNESCTLTLRDCVLKDTRGAGTAILTDGPDTVNPTLINTAVEGFAETAAHKPPRRTEAPADMAEAVWPADKLEDAHAPVTEAEEALCRLTQLYDGRKVRFGDMHAHSNSGGTSDGATPLRDFVKQLKALGLDFAAVVDHRQIRHAFLPEWDEDLLIPGSEPGTRILEEGRPKRSSQMHYVMLFPRPTDLYRVMAAFPEFEFTGGPDGHFCYPKFTVERMRELGEFIYSLGGLMAHAHPKQLMASDDPLHYYFGDKVPLETVLGSAESFDTIQNARLWEALLKMGKRMHTHGDSDTHGAVSDWGLTAVYTHRRTPADVLATVREGDCTAGWAGIQMAINCTKMGGSTPYRKGLTLAVRVADYYRPHILENTVYCLKIYTDKGLAYAAEFNGKQPQTVVLPVKKRKYYRAVVMNESDGTFVAISNPIWLD